jgi:glyoxylase-like metal-dependent hydrolase (beta-lactamase superfamily II)
MIPISEHIEAVMHDDTTDLPYLFLIHGSRWNLQIDAGNSPASRKRFEAAVQQAGFTLPGMIALTHWHWDHTFGMAGAGVPVAAGDKTAAYLHKAAQWQWTEEAMRQRLRTGEDILFCYEHMHAEYPDITKIKVAEPDLVFHEPLEFSLGDVHVQAVPHDSPHTRDAVFYYVPEDRVLLGGDAEYPDYYDYHSAYDVERLKDFIAFLEKLDFDLYAHGHDASPVITKKEILNMLEEDIKNPEPLL